MTPFVPGRCRGLGVVGPHTQLPAGYGSGHDPGVVGGDDAVDRGFVADADDRLGSKIGVRAIDLEIAVPHVERRRVFGNDDEVDAEPFRGTHEVGGTVGGAGEENDSCGHGIESGDQLPSLQMSEDTVLSIAPDALDMILQLRDQEPGDGEFALSIEVTGFRGPQFTYELAFVALDDKKEGWVVERHRGLALIYPRR